MSSIEQIVRGASLDLSPRPSRVGEQLAAAEGATISDDLRIDANSDTYEWDGWPLARSYDGHFDRAARRRMVAGQAPLAARLAEHASRLRGELLEIGPFFTPLATPARFPDCRIIYWENDPYAVTWLRRTHGTYGKADVVTLDLLDAEAPGFLTTTREHLASHDAELLDVAIISQVLNYVDYRALLRVVASAMRSGGLVAVNNVVNYGLPLFFADRRPQSVEETIATIEATGFDVVCCDVIPAQWDVQAGEPRLVILAEKRAT